MTRKSKIISSVDKALRIFFSPVIPRVIVEAEKEPEAPATEPALPDYSLIPLAQAQADFFKAVMDDDIGTMNLVHRAYTSAHTWTSTVDPSSTSSSEPIALIHYAALGKGDALCWLLDKGIDIETVDRFWFKCTPLYLAAQRGNAQTVKILLDRGADPFAPSLYKDACNMVDEARRFGFDKDGSVAALLMAARAKIETTRKPPLVAPKPKGGM